MQVLIQPGAKRRVLVTIAIGKPYFDSWKTFAFPGWKVYCERHGLGLVVFDEDLIDQNDPHWKKATWQKMLIGERLIRAGLPVDEVCYADTDILINPFAPDIFESYTPETIALVSLRRNLPYDLHLVQRKLAFLRHTRYDANYPLDSALFMSLEQLYGYHGLPMQKDEACMGLFVFNVASHSQIMRQWFDKYDRNVKSVTGGGDQTHINFEMQNWGNVSWLDYRFQAMWVYEMAWKYPFLYDRSNENRDLVVKCIEASLGTNHFLHFAGSWHESEMWKFGRVFEETSYAELQEFHKYLATPVTGEARGQIKPGTVSVAQ